MSRETEAGHWYARMHGSDADSSRATFDKWRRDPANAAAYAAYEDDWTLTGSIAPAPRARSRSEREAARFAPGGVRWALATAAAIAIALLFAWNIDRGGDTAQNASGPMLPGQLRETTMDPTKRTLLRVEVVASEAVATGERVESLMGNKPEARFRFIQERAEFATDLDV